MPAPEFPEPPPQLFGEEAAKAPPPPQRMGLEDVPVGPVVEVPLQREGDDFVGSFDTATLKPGHGYRLVIHDDAGGSVLRRDPWALHTDFKSSWCIATDPAAWRWRQWQLPTYDTYVIYEMHVGSFTPEGSFEAARAKLAHIADLGFTCVQLMPITEHSDHWGYNPRQLLALHGKYGSPAEFQAFVDEAHALGLAVVIDVVLHHGAVDGNALWDFDGWGANMDGGIYHEGGADTEWGRGYAFWKNEVLDYVKAACDVMLATYRCDGLRFDSINDLPHHITQAITYHLRDKFPGRILMAELTPEDPFKMKDLGLDALWVHSGYFDIIQQHRALGRGHHGGGDWADGWDLPRLRTVMALHYGFENPTQCVKYLLGSHDQIGCANGGAWYQDYQMVGGQHRYPVDQYGGGRTDGNAMAAQRTWYTAGIAAAGLHMMFMGTEWAQTGWWHTDEHHRLQWQMADDEAGRSMMALTRDANNLRKEYPVLRIGWSNILHEDRQNGVVAFERVHEGQTRMLVVLNAGQNSWQCGDYGVWVGGGSFRQVFNCQDAKYGGWEGVHTNDGDLLHSYDGKLWINIPGQCTLIFVEAVE